MLLMVAQLGFAQYKTVNYNYEKNWFNESERLPAGSHWILNGGITPNTSMVEVEVFRTSNTAKDPLHASSWRNPFQGQLNMFSIPVQYKLVGNSKYTIVLSYFRSVQKDEKQKLQDLINDALDAYIRQMVESNATQVRLRKNPKLIIQDLDAIVREGTRMYRSANGLRFNGFSDLVEDKLNQIDELKLRKAKFNMQKEQGDDKGSIRVKYLERNLQEIQAMVRKEVAQFIGSDLLVQQDRRVMEDYETEKVKYVIPINAGVITTFSTAGPSQNSYGIAPSVGFSVPLGRKGFAKPFWSNSSVSFGVALMNFDFGSSEATGPIIQRPFYIGYGYRVLNILRVHAGIVTLQTKQPTAQFNFNGVYISPQIGVSLELGLWLGMIK